MTLVPLALLLAVQVADTTATKAALLAADRALPRGDAILAWLEPGAAVLLPGQPILRGAGGARVALRDRYAAPGVRYSWTPLHAVASSDGRFGCTTGASEMTVPRDTAKTPRRGRYLTCWRRVRGAWRIVVLARVGESPGDPDANVPVPAWPHSATDSSSSIDGPMRADAEFAKLGLDSGPGPAFAHYVAPDGMLLGARPVPPAGPDSIRARFNAFPVDQRLMWAPIQGMGMASGGLAVTVGEATTGPPGGAPVSFSKYVTVWRLEPYGEWRFVFDIGSARPAR